MQRLAFTSMLAAATGIATAVTTTRTLPPAAARRDAPGTQHAVGYYDAVARRVVVVGGTDQPRTGDRDRVWSWTGRRWEPAMDAGPPARGNAGAAWDARRRVAVVTGGMRRASDSSFQVIAETWEGARDGWRPAPGADIPPRDHQSLVYDERRGAVLMFGGILADRAAPWPTDTWERRADGWTRIASEGPPGRGRAGLAYDARRRQVVLFGGAGQEPAPGQPQPFFADTWVLDGSRWRKVADGGPRGRYAHGMVYDERAGVVLVYGGHAAHRDAPLGDMWKWDGRRWTEIRLTGPTPGHRYQPVMVYDRARGRTVLFGGLGAAGDTWEWDGRRWEQVAR